MIMRSGFSSVELMVVLSVMAVLTSIAVPSVVPAVRKAQLGSAAVGIEDIATQARTLSMAMPGYTTGASYGVVIVQDQLGQAYAALTYGTSATVADIVADGGAAAASVQLSPSVAVFTAPGSGASPSVDSATAASAATALSGSIGWRYEPRTGVPMIAGSRAIGIGIGRAASTETTSGGDVFQWPSPLADHLSVRTVDGAGGVAVQIYGFGGSSRVEL
ncbi:MAG: type II secretion system protein [Planctomycetota bacterium]|jgi:prepilin-type N-terminal cleavage/methylation domain-containing protein|nr:type II secretion system protein [Planctomycetota bacterium]